MPNEKRRRRGFTGSRTSRADLVSCLAVDEVCLEVMAPKLGFNLVEEHEQPHEASDARPPRTQPQQIVPRPYSEAAGNLGFWLVRTRRRKTEDEKVSGVPRWFEEARALGAHESGAPEGEVAETPPPPPPLAPPGRLWPFLRRALGGARHSRHLDECKLMRWVGKGQPIHELPLKKKKHWSSFGQVIVDRNPRLSPFWGDFAEAIELLVKVRGRSGLRIWQFDRGPEAGCRDWFEPLAPARAYKPPPSGTSVLVIGDLGCYATGPSTRRAWLRFGRFLKEEGLAASALLCLPPRLWDRELEEAWRPVFWDRGLPLNGCAPMALGLQGGGMRVERAHGAQALLTLLAPSVRVEPPLLRAARFLLPPGKADVGSEYYAWTHPDIVSDLSALAYKPDSIAKYREAFKTLAHGLRQELARLLKAYHALLPFSIREEEANILLGLLDGEREPPRPDDLMARVAKAFQMRSETPRLRAWFSRLSRRQDRWSWRDVRLAAAYLFAEDSDPRRRLVAFPAGFPLDEVHWVLKGKLEPESWTLFQQGRALRSRRGKTENLEEENGFHQGQALAWTSSRTGALGFQYEDEPERYLALREEGLIAMPERRGEGLMLHTDSEVLEVGFQEKPPWADQIGYSSKGLFVRVRESGRKAFWLQPNQTLCSTKIQSGGASAGLRLEEGRWVWENQFDRFREGLVPKPSWAKGIGSDEYGVFALLEFKGVAQRLRLIPPGEFSMGSPGNEPEREGSEAAHPVILTRAFWLGETPVTQALWRAIMGGNPSKFKGLERPVEKVSWKDAQEFIQKANKRKPELGLRLPTEAEWEYACRSDTKTPFHFGSQITTEQVNYNSEFPYGGGEKGVSRKETVEVYALPGNAWGLYQMHGNVREWCMDWSGNYPDFQVIDPRGSGWSGYRALRGGSWFTGAGLCRSAYRFNWLPAARIYDAGFRLAADYPEPWEWTST